jgi:hypothetical protein
MSDHRCDNSTCYHKELDREVGHGSKLYIDKFFFSPDLFDNLTNHKISCCGTVRPKRKGIPLDLLVQNGRRKRGHIWLRITQSKNNSVLCVMQEMFGCTT